MSLSWQPLNVTNITIEYEVVYIIDSECSSDSLPDNGYNTVNTTTNTSIEVYGLMSDTCYVFSVRSIAPVYNSMGQFSTINTTTVSDGRFVRLLVYGVIISLAYSYFRLYSHSS